MRFGILIALSISSQAEGVLRNDTVKNVELDPAKMGENYSELNK